MRRVMAMGRCWSCWPSGVILDARLPVPKRQRPYAQWQNSPWPGVPNWAARLSW